MYGITQILKHELFQYQRRSATMSNFLLMKQQNVPDLPVSPVVHLFQAITVNTQLLSWLNNVVDNIVHKM